MKAKDMLTAAKELLANNGVEVVGEINHKDVKLVAVDDGQLAFVVIRKVNEFVESTGITKTEFEKVSRKWIENNEAHGDRRIRLDTCEFIEVKDGNAHCRYTVNETHWLGGDEEVRLVSPADSNEPDVRKHDRGAEGASRGT